jgi:hypothetical protein
MSSHTFPEVSAHLLAATPTCHWLEYVDRAAPILAEPLRIVDGLAQVPDRPGPARFGRGLGSGRRQTLSHGMRPT